MSGSTGEQALMRRADGEPASGPGPWAMFFKGFLKHPVMVGSIIPSSGKLIRRMLSRTDWQNTKLFVEYGPGVGTFCQAVLDQMSADATYLAIDTNPDFIAYLKRKFKDPRLVPVLGSAADVRKIMADRGFERADYILSGLPFSTLPPGVGPRIVAETHAALRTEGAFLVYQFSPKVRDFLAASFNKIDHQFEPVNVPPAQLYWAWRD